MCSVQCAVCSVYSLLCGLQCAVCSRFVQCEVCGVFSLVCSLQSLVYSEQCVAFLKVQLTGKCSVHCCKHCAVNRVQCTVMLTVYIGYLAAVYCLPLSTVKSAVKKHYNQILSVMYALHCTLLYRVNFSAGRNNTNKCIIVICSLFQHNSVKYSI